MKLILTLIAFYLACAWSSTRPIIQPRLLGEICAGPTETVGTCTKTHTFNYNKKTKACEQVLPNTGPCGFFHVQLKCEIMCTVINSTLIHKSDHLKHDAS